MNKKLFFNCLILLALFACLISCKKDKESQPSPVIKLITEAEMPVIQDLAKLHKDKPSASFKLIGTPKSGKAEFIKAGLLMYSPNEDASETIDVVNYQVCEGANCENANLSIQVLAKGVASKPGDVCEQGAFWDVAYMSLPNNQITIDVLANDAFCDNPVDPSTLQITINYIGIATVKDGKIIYQIDPSKFVGGEYNTLTYQVSEKGKPDNIKYAGVTVFIKSSKCELVANDNSFSLTTPNKPLIMKVLENDEFCNTPVEFSTFQIVNPPTVGTVSIQGNEIIYQVEPDKIVDAQVIRFQYQVAEKRKPDNIKTANVDIYICNLVANDDVISLTLPNNQIVIKVLENDYFCNSPIEFTNFQLKTTLKLGTASIQGNEILYQIDPSKFKGGETETFSYQVAEKSNPNNIKYGNIVVNINPGNCELVVRDDYYQIEINNGWSTRLNILKNDNFCDNLLISDTLEAIKIITPPAHGKIGQRELGSYSKDYASLGSYYPDFDYEGDDQLTYQIKYKDGTTKQGVIHIKVSGGAFSCINVVPQAKDDMFTYQNTYLVERDSKIYIPFSYNDVICSLDRGYAKAMITQNIPSSQGTLTDNFLYTLPSPTFTGKVVFKYQICDVYNRCSEATVTLNITD